MNKLFRLSEIENIPLQLQTLYNTGFLINFPKISLRGHFYQKSVVLRFYCVHLNPFCSECCTDRLIAMQISKWPRKNPII